MCEGKSVLKFVILCRRHGKLLYSAGSFEDHRTCKRMAAFEFVFETNSTRIVHPQPQRKTQSVYFCTLQKSVHVSIKGAVTLCNLSRNLSRNFVATQVESEIARCNIPRNHKVTQHFCCKKHCTK